MKKRGKKERSSRKKKITFFLVAVVFLIGIIFFSLYLKTGFLQSEKIDERDLEYWDYSMAGTIAGAEEFYLPGDKETCWLMIHGYGSTPNDFKGLSKEINSEFGDYVSVPRLKGHGEIPSKLLGLSFSDWYAQAEGDYKSLDQECSKINLVGFSFGGALALKLAEEHSGEDKIQRIYLISPFIRLRYKWWNVLKKETIINIFADIIVFKKKGDPAQINSPEGLKSFIGYKNLPWQSLKNSFKDIKLVEANLNKISNPILIQQSKNDDTVDVKSSKLVYEKVSSDKKELVIFKTMFY